MSGCAGGRPDLVTCEDEDRGDLTRVVEVASTVKTSASTNGGEFSFTVSNEDPTVQYFDPGTLYSCGGFPGTGAAEMR